jgi:hypothetical protein
MNPTILLIFTILGGALVLLSAYGALKLDRRFFLSGFCFYSILPIIGESMGYNADKGAAHLLMVFMFVTQFVLKFPDGKIYARDNSIAVAFATKIGFAALLTNAGAAVYVFCLSTGLPVQFGYYHIAFIVIELYIMIKGLTSSGSTSWLK